MGQTQSSTRISEVGRVMVPVADQDRAIEFYVGTLGFEKRADIPFGHGDRWVESVKETAGQEVVVPLSKPLRGEGGLVILKGNIAPEGSVVKITHHTPTSHRGPARFVLGGGNKHERLINYAAGTGSVCFFSASCSSSNVVSSNGASPAKTRWA